MGHHSCQRFFQQITFIHYFWFIVCFRGNVMLPRLVSLVFLHFLFQQYLISKQVKDLCFPQGSTEWIFECQIFHLSRHLVTLLSITVFPYHTYSRSDSGAFSSPLRSQMWLWSWPMDVLRTELQRLQLRPERKALRSMQWEWPEQIWPHWEPWRRHPSKITSSWSSRSISFISLDCSSRISSVVRLQNTPK